MKFTDVEKKIKEYFDGDFVEYHKAYEPDVKIKRDRIRNLSDEIINSGSSETVLQYLKDNCEKITEYECKVLIKKYVGLERFKKVEKDNANRKYAPVELTDIPGMGKIMFGLVNEEEQHTSKGCWACAYSSLLKSRKIELNQAVIRGYRGDETKGERTAEFKEVNSDSFLNPTDKADILMKLVPNTAMREISFKIDSEQLEYKPSELDTDEIKAGYKALKEDVKKDLVNLIVTNARKSLVEDKSPVAFLLGKHFVTIVGLTDNGNLLIYDSERNSESKPDPIEINPSEYIDTEYDDTNGNISMVSLVDIKLNKEKPSQTELSDDFKYFDIKENGEVNAHFENPENVRVMEDSAGIKSYNSTVTEELPTSKFTFSKTIYVPKKLNTQVIELENPVEASKEEVVNNQPNNNEAAEIGLGKVDELVDIDRKIKKDKIISDKDVSNKLSVDVLHQLNELRVKPDDDKRLFEIKKSISDDWTRNNDHDYIERLCFNYIVDNMYMANNPAKRERFDIVLGGLAVLDFKLAERLEHEINGIDSIKKDRNNYNRKHKKTPIEPVNALKALEKCGINQISGNYNHEIITKAEEDPRIVNIQKLYDKLNEKNDEKSLGALFHINTTEYENMMRAMRHCLVYSKMIKGNSAKREVLDEMLKNVAETATDYILKKGINQSTELGQARFNLALAVLYSADRQLGKDMIEGIAFARKDKNDNNKKIGDMVFGDIKSKDLDKSDYLSIDKIVKETQISTEIAHEEKLSMLHKSITAVNTKIPKDKAGLSELWASYIVKRLMYEKLSKMTPEESKSVGISGNEISNATQRMVHSPAFIKACDELGTYYANMGFGTAYISEDIIFHKYNEVLAKESQKEAEADNKQKDELKVNKEIEAAKKNMK